MPAGRPANVEAAKDLGSVHDAEASHQSVMGEHMDRMSHEIGDVGGCMDGDDNRPDTRHMAAHMDAMAAELAEHDHAMGAVVELEGALDEEHRHEGATRVLLEQMGAEVDDMMSDRGGMISDHDCGDDMHGQSPATRGAAQWGSILRTREPGRSTK